LAERGLELGHPVVATGLVLRSLSAHHMVRLLQRLSSSREWRDLCGSILWLDFGGVLLSVVVVGVHWRRLRSGDSFYGLTGRSRLLLLCVVVFLSLRY
jgi:hypothetical protein